MRVWTEKFRTAHDFIHRVIIESAVFSFTRKIFGENFRGNRNDTVVASRLFLVKLIAIFSDAPVPRCEVLCRIVYLCKTGQIYRITLQGQSPPAFYFLWRTNRSPKNNTRFVGRHDNRFIVAGICFQSKTPAKYFPPNAKARRCAHETIRKIRETFGREKFFFLPRADNLARQKLVSIFFYNIVCFHVGLGRIELPLHEPESCVLPVYYSPNFSNIFLCISRRSLWRSRDPVLRHLTDVGATARILNYCYRGIYPPTGGLCPEELGHSNTAGEFSQENE